MRLAGIEKLIIYKYYNPGVINAAMGKAKAIPRTEALKKEPQKENKFRRPILLLTYNPCLCKSSETLYLKSSEKYQIIHFFKRFQPHVLLYNYMFYLSFQCNKRYKF